MPVQLPERSAAQVADIKEGIAVNSLYPYTFRINRTFTAGNFPSSDAGGSGNFVQFIWTPQISLGIVIIEGLSTQPSGAGFAAAIQVSLSSTMTLGDAPSLILPTDEASILYTGIFSQSSIASVENRFLPSDYYILQATPIFVSFWVSSGAIGQAGSIISTLVIHTIPLGVGS